ncbi:hypothetical protein EMPS_00492 [Entomortierella parvispora]|uniref:Uncharacterized protein n=1 Tax=Entomortierella parvispora TaxID=205924 RepID=A0A9P3H140_9FUNG|nr:hypothetical protein EMPS_00492 [Entomortierella parvispora]
MASRPEAPPPSTPLVKDQRSSHSAPLGPQGKLHEGIPGHGPGASHHSHLPPRRTAQRLRHIDPFLEKCIEKFIQGSTYGRGIKPILKAAVVPGQKAFRFMPLDRLMPRDHEKLRVRLKYDESASQNPTWVNRWMRVFGTAPRLDDSYLNIPVIVCKRSGSGIQSQVPLHRTETYMNIRNEQNRNTAVERICTGIKYAQQNLLEKALGEYSLAIDADPSCAAAYLTRGCTFANMCMWQEAVDDFLSVLKIDPSDISAQQYLATAMEERRSWMAENRMPAEGPFIGSQVSTGYNASATANRTMDVQIVPQNRHTNRQHRAAHAGDDNDGERGYLTSTDTQTTNHNKHRTSVNTISLEAQRVDISRHRQNVDKHPLDVNLAHHQSQESDNSRGGRGDVIHNRTYHSTDGRAYVRSRSRSRSEKSSISITRRLSNNGKPVRGRSPHMDDGTHIHVARRTVGYPSRSPSLPRSGHRYTASSPVRNGHEEGNGVLESKGRNEITTGRRRERRSPSPWNGFDMSAIPTGPRIPEAQATLAFSPQMDVSTSLESYQRLTTPPTKKRRESGWVSSKHGSDSHQANKSSISSSRGRHQHSEHIDDDKQHSSSSLRRSPVGGPEKIRSHSPSMYDAAPAAIVFTATTETKAMTGTALVVERATGPVALPKRVQDSRRGLSPTVEGISCSSGSPNSGTDQAEVLLANIDLKDDKAAPAKSPALKSNPLPSSEIPARRGRGRVVTLDRDRDLSDLSKSLSFQSTAQSRESVGRPSAPSELKLPNESGVDPVQLVDSTKKEDAVAPAAQEADVVFFRRRQ